MAFRLTFLLSLFFPFLLRAQIVIDASDVPPFGAALTTSTDTLVAGLQPGPGGINQSWDFSMLAGQESTANLVVNPVETPNGASFPEATFAFKGANDFYSYAQVTADALLALGGSAALVEGVDPVILNFDPPQHLLPLPATYGSTFNNNYGFALQLDGSVINPLIDSVRVMSNSTQSAEIDGAGALALPGATYETLRQRLETVNETVIEVKFFGSWTPFESSIDTIITYQWWAGDGRGTVLSIDYNPQGEALEATYLSGFTEELLPPLAAFSVEIIENALVQFTDESGNQPSEWAWNFGDGTTSSEQNPLHTYPEGGLYNACLTVSNLAGQSTVCQEVNALVNSAGEASAPAGLKAYPSPASEVLFLEFGELEGKAVALSLFNSLGQALLRQPFDQAPAGAWALDISGLQPGLYRVVVESRGQGRKVLAFVKRDQTQR